MAMWLFCKTPKWKDAQCRAPRNPHSRGRGRGGALQANQDGGAANNRSSTEPHQLQDPSQAPPSPVTRRPSKTLRGRDANVEPFKKKATRRRGEALPSVAIGSSSAMVTSWHGSAGQGGAWSGRSPARYWQSWRHRPARWRRGDVDVLQNAEMERRTTSRPPESSHARVVGAEPYQPTRTEARQTIEAPPSPTNCKNQAKPHRAR